MMAFSILKNNHVLRIIMTLITKTLNVMILSIMTKYNNTQNMTSE